MTFETREASTWQDLKGNPQGAQEHSLNIPVFSFFAHEGIPMYAKLTVSYVARQYVAVEESFRDMLDGMYSEVLPADVALKKIIDTFVACCEPWAVQVRMETQLAGVNMTPTARWEHPDLRQQPQIMTAPGQRM